MSKKILIFVGVIALGIGITIFSGVSHSKKATTKTESTTHALSTSSVSTSENSMKQSDESEELNVVNQFIKAYYNYSTSDEQKEQLLPLCTADLIKNMALDVKGNKVIAKSKLEDVKIGVTKDGEYLCLIKYEFSGLGIRPDFMELQTREVNGKVLIDSVTLPKAD